MKKMILGAFATISLALSSCGVSNLGNYGSLGGTTTTDGSTSLGTTATNGLLDLILGSVKLSQTDILGTWKYVEPSCAFTSENLLAKAGGAVAAQQAKAKLAPAYNSLGINASNTQFVFNQDGTFSGTLKNVPLSGNYTFNATDGSIKMQTMLMSMTAYLTRTSQDLSFNFESKKLLNVLQTQSSLSGNSTLQTVGDLSKNYDGIRVGFNMAH